MTNATVLLIDASTDDERLFREELALVRDQPFALEVARSLAAGLAQLRQRRFDVILLELNLPDSLGLTTFLRLQPKAGLQPIIVLVGQADEDVGVEAVERGALDFLIKQQIVSTLLAKALRYATERTHTMLALKASESRYRELYENVVAGVFQTTPDGKFMAANPALVRLLGYNSEDELLELSIGEDLYVHADDRANWLRNMAAAGEIRNAELILRRKDGRKIVVLENSRAVRDEHGRILYYEGTLTDITEAHELSRQLSYEASHDALSGLINRREFEIRLQRALDSAQATGTSHAVCYVDLDQFKVINDTCGHVAGDELLRQLAQLLQSRVRSNDALARLGGDEFGLLLHDCSMTDAIGIANMLLKVVEQYQFVWGASTFTRRREHRRGVAERQLPADHPGAASRRRGVLRGEGSGPQSSARLSGRRCCRRAAPRRDAMGGARQARTERKSLSAGSATDRVVAGSGDAHATAPRAYELLLRMRDEDGSIVPPGAFLPAVERYNLMPRVDQWVIATALRWLAANPATTQRIGRVYVNLSGDSLGDPQLHDFILAALDETRVPPAKIGFEITETAAIGNLTRANQLIGELRRLGCAFSLDDFGSGVSSFAYLKALTVDWLKIDGLFVGNMVHDRVDYEMVRSITDIGHVMGKKVVAESVESAAVLEQLRQVGVDYAQGNALGPPMPLDTL